MRVLITGSNGMLGSELVRRIGERDEILGLGNSQNVHTGLSYIRCDVGDRNAVENAVESSACDWIIHAAAMTNVDACEDQPEEAMRVNADGARHVAEAARSRGVQAVFISTDYVFDGRKKTPYEEEDEPHPLSVYGRSKWIAEKYWMESLPEGMIVRSSWVFGRAGHNFARAIIDKVIKGVPMRVVSDQWGSPTYAPDLADALWKVIHQKPAAGIVPPKIIHFTNSGATSRFEWARQIARLLGADPELVQPIRTSESDRRAERPKRGILSIGLWKKMHKESPRDIWSATSAYIKEEFGPGYGDELFRTAIQSNL